MSVKGLIFVCLTLTFIFSSEIIRPELRNEQEDEIINLSDYDYPRPEQGDSNLRSSLEYTIAILGTNDIHGRALPMNLTNPITKETYLFGGLEYLSYYVKTLKNQWGNRLLWIDSGDQFQGTIENVISNGTIITDFYNIAKVDGSTIGNHEWDFGRSFLNSRLQAANWEYVIGNVYNNLTNKPEILYNSVTQKLFKVGDVKIGVIGLTTLETPFTTTGDLTYLYFKDYKDVIKEKARILRKEGANAIIINAHVGLACLNEDEEKIVLRIRIEKDIQGTCEQTDEMYKLLHSLPDGTVDAVVSGHIHNGVHHWINKIPVIQNPDGGDYFNVMYLTFDYNLNLVKEKIKIEGPIPVCDKILKSTHTCSPMDKKNPKTNTTLHNYIFHESQIKADPEILKVFSKWKDQLEKYKKIVGYTNVNLQPSFLKETDLGNMITDIMRTYKKAMLQFSIMED